MKFKNKLKRSTVLLLALVIASVSSLAVYAAVNYNSATDPVVSLSGMVSYVDSALSDVRTAINSLDSRLTKLELGGVSGGSQGGASVDPEVLGNIIKRLSDVELLAENLLAENKKLKEDLDRTNNELTSIYNEMTQNYNEIKSSISSLSSDITSLQNQITAAKNDVITLQKNFNQIADISTKLETVSYKLNQLTSSSGDIATLKKQYKELKEQYDSLLSEMGKIYAPVYVPYGSTVIAAAEEDSILLVLRSGSAIAVSPYTEPGTMQGLNDLTLGIDIYNGEPVLIFHHIMIPRGGKDGRGVKVTSLEGAYFLLGGDYKIVAE